MTGSHIISSELHRSIQKNIKLDFAIAENIRIGCAAGFVFGKHVINNALFVFATEVYRLKWNAEMLCYNHRIVAVIQPRAFVTDGNGIVMPVFHEHADHFIALLF